MANITTYTGKSINPLFMKESDISSVDISHALSFMTRANGHFKSFYSVAKHSINCAIEARARGYDIDVQLGCLMHDASEAYLSDITRPIKPLLPKYLEIEEELQNKIYKHYIGRDLELEELSLIKEIDDELLIIEFDKLMITHDFYEVPKFYGKLQFMFEPFDQVEKQFITILYELQKEKDSRS